MWKSFYIQGFISDFVPFPVNEFKNLNFDNEDAIIETFLKESGRDHKDKSILFKH